MKLSLEFGKKNKKIVGSSFFINNFNKKGGIKITVSRTFKFPGGSIVLYSHPEDLGEIILYSKRRIFFKVFYNLKDLENTFDELVKEIEEEFVKAARSVLSRKYILKDLLKL